MRIGEAARRSGVSARMLRHYDALGLVSPTGRTVGGYREYAPEDLRRLFHVEGLRVLGLSLAQVGRALDDPDFAPEALVADLVRATEARLARDRELLGRLRTIDAAAPADWSEVIGVVELIRELDSPDASRRARAVLSPDAVGGVGGGAGEALARSVLAESDPTVSGALRWALVRSGRAAVDPLCAAVHDDDAEVRRRAVSALAELDIDQDPDGGAAAVTAALAAALRDEDPTVRRWAALAVGGRGDPAATPTLVAMIVAGEGDVDAAEVLAALSRDDPGEAERVLVALAEEIEAADVPTRIRLVQALVELPGSAAKEVLARLVRDEDRTVALVAAALAGTRAAG